MTERPRYHVNDVSRDTLTLDPRIIQIGDARLRAEPPSLEREGFALFPRKSTVCDVGNLEDIARTYRSETERLLLELLVRGCPGDDRAVPPALEERRHFAPEILAPRRVGVAYRVCGRTRCEQWCQPDLAGRISA